MNVSTKNVTNLYGYNEFLKLHKSQLESSGVPELFWETLFKKLKDEVFNCYDIFRLAKVVYENETRRITDPTWKLIVSASNGINALDPNNIYLIDHAWLYSIRDARQHLTEIPSLLDRMCNLMDIDTNAEKEELIENVLNEMWRYNQYFSLNSQNVEESMPMWYIMDELGSAINHSDNPNSRMIPFLYVPQGVTYTLLFPIRDIAAEEEVTRDFVEGQADGPWMRRVLLLPWVPNTFNIESFEQSETDQDFIQNYISETLPETYTFTGSNDRTLKVYSEYEYVNKYLTNPAFRIVDNDKEADILWLVSHFKAFKELSISSPHVFINQFPCEHVITVKDLLAVVCRRKGMGKQHDPDTLETYPAWLPTTYNLVTELKQFICYFNARAEKNLDNHWICKPWNLARGLDIHITKNLFHILRIRSTGPKIAQKYITDPVLYDRPHTGKVKFDIRYVVLLKSIKPLQIYAYVNFFLRFANQPFALNNLDVYKQHFTVMNYSDEDQLYHMKCAEFVVQWKKQYPAYPWETYVEPRILSVLHEAFEAATLEPPPRGIPESPQSRAVYAVDLMLEWCNSEMQPKLLEINFMPDCQRACNYYPEFYNDVFRCLFLDAENSQIFHKLHSTEK